MRQINPVSLLFFVIALFIAGCAGTGPSRPWVYQPQQQQPAQSAPSPIAGPHAQIMQVPSPDLPMSDNQVERLPLEEERLLQAPAITAQPQTPGAKIALLLPLSGEHEELGNAMLKAAQMAFFDVGGGAIELLPRDTKGTASGAREAAEAAIQDGAELILGPIFADAARAAKSVAQRRNISMISFSTDWSVSGGNAFIMGFLPFDQVERVIEYAAANNLRRIGVLAPNTDYGRAVISAYQAMAPARGIQTVDIAVFSANGSDMSQVARSFARYDERQQALQSMGEGAEAPPAPFDAVLLPAGGDTARSLGNLLSQYDLPPRSVRRLGTGLWDDPALAADQGLSGGWFAAPSPQGRESFETRFTRLYKDSPPRLASLAYDATALAAVLARTGIQLYGRPDFSAQAITNPNGFAGIDGIFRFRPDGNVERGLAVLELRNGQRRIISAAPKTFQQPGTYR